MVFAGFSQATALAARAGDAARVSAQEAQLTAQARLAVAMLQRLTRAESDAAHDEGSDDSLLRSEPGADEIMSELEPRIRTGKAFEYWHVVCARVVDKWRLNERDHTQIFCYSSISR